MICARRPAIELEALKGAPPRTTLIRINDQWRICFTWRDGGTDHSIVDYH